MEIFTGQNIIEFSSQFQTDENCSEYLGKLKRHNGYKCRKCGHSKFQTRKNTLRTCNKCRDTESPCVNTLFHRVRFGLLKDFLHLF